jgi:steroid delta-isomerase-like uncharacterized protein
MSNDARKRAVYRWVTEMWGGGNLALADELVGQDYVYRAVGMPEVRGAAGIREMVTTVRAALPDLTNTVELQVAEGDIVVTRGTTRGTHLGPWAETPASGNSVTLPWVLISRFEGDKIIDEFEAFDTLGMMQQIGAIPVAARAAT